jgi:ribosomal protein S18 acetylase RimI-like enzyme
MRKSGRFGSVIRTRQVVADDWRVWRGLRLDALGEAPHAFSSKLAEWQGEGDTEPRWRARLQSVPLNVIADRDRAPVGMVSAVMEGEATELISMWVSPDARGAGVGDALIEAVLQWSVAVGLARVTLRVVEGNDHAVGLYRRHGFVDTGPVEHGGPEALVERWMVRR